MRKTKSELNRLSGKYQVDEQRNNILNAAEKLFLENGLGNTSMVDIAREAGITKVTLYRYFPNRRAIALEIHIRMLNKIFSSADPNEQYVTIAGARKTVKSMIDNFVSLRDAYRYVGMFDSIYLDNPTETSLTQWTKEQLASRSRNISNLQETIQRSPQGESYNVILASVLWFLEKLALRGELTWSDQMVPLEEHLKLFEEMILGYIDKLIERDMNHVQT